MPQLAIVKDQPDDLRVRLREAIRYRDALLDDAAKAQSAFDNSKHLLCDAAERAQALKAELDAEAAGSYGTALTGDPGGAQSRFRAAPG